MSGRRGGPHRRISDRRLPPCDSQRSGLRARGVARDQPGHGVGHAPAMLLGGSPLDMAAPPSPSSPCGRDHTNIPGRTSYRAVHARHRPGHRGRRAVDGAGTVPLMDLAYPPEAEEFRTEIAGWLKENLPEGWGEPGLLHDARGAQGLQPGVDGQALRRRMDLRQLADRVRRQGPEPAATGRAQRGVRPGRCAAARRLLRRHARRPHDPAVGHRGAEASSSSPAS